MLVLSARNIYVSLTKAVKCNFLLANLEQKRIFFLFSGKKCCKIFSSLSSTVVWLLPYLHFQNPSVLKIKSSHILSNTVQIFFSALHSGKVGATSLSSWLASFIKHRQAPFQIFPFENCLITPQYFNTQFWKICFRSLSQCWDDGACRFYKTTLNQSSLTFHQCRASPAAGPIGIETVSARFSQNVAMQIGSGITRRRTPHLRHVGIGRHRLQRQRHRLLGDLLPRLLPGTPIILIHFCRNW